MELADGVMEALELTNGDAVSLRVCENEGVKEKVGVGLQVWVWVAEAVGVWVAVRVPTGVGVRLGLADGEKVREGERGHATARLFESATRPNPTLTGSIINDFFFGGGRPSVNLDGIS